MPAKDVENRLEANNCDPIQLIYSGELRVICSNSLEHAKITSLCELGLSSADIENITGFNKIEFQHLVR